MSHLVSHAVTNTVSHRCPDQTRPDQTSLKVVCGVSGTTSIDLTVGLDSPPDAWMETDDLDLLDENVEHATCTRCWPEFKPGTVVVGVCGTRHLVIPNYGGRCAQCAEIMAQTPRICPKCGNR